MHSAASASTCFDGFCLHFCSVQIASTKLSSLPGLKPPKESDPKELVVVREAYELACMHISLQLNDVPGFERHMSQV